MLIALWLLLIGSGFFFKTSKKLAFCQCLFATWMIAYDNGNPDQFNYIQIFNNVKADPSLMLSQSTLYNFLMYVFGVFNDYNIALFILCGLSFFLMYKGIKYFTSNISLVLSLYLISPFVIDGTQVRNFVAMCVWIYIIQYLYKAVEIGKFERNALIYAIGVLIVSLIHFSYIYTILYLMAIFLKKGSFKSLIKSGFIFLILFGVISNISKLIPLFSNSSFEGLRQTSTAFSNYSANYVEESANSRLMLTIIFFVLIFLILLIYKNSSVDKSYYWFVVKLTIMLLPILFLINYSMEIYRMQRNMLIIYYILFAVIDKNYSFRYSNVKWKNDLMPVISLIPAIFYLITESILWNYDAVFKMMFHY